MEWASKITHMNINNPEKLNSGLPWIYAFANLLLLSVILFVFAVGQRLCRQRVDTGVAKYCAKARQRGRTSGRRHLRVKISSFTIISEHSSTDNLNVWQIHEEKCEDTVCWKAQ